MFCIIPGVECGSQVPHMVPDFLFRNSIPASQGAAVSTAAGYDFPVPWQGRDFAAADSFCACVTFVLLGTLQRVHKC